MKVKGDFELWLKKNKEKKEELEKNRKNVLKKTINSLNKLANQFGFHKAYIFGSVIKTGKFGQNSDVDIAIKGLNKFMQYKLVASLSSLIDREVDVILLEDECHFKDVIIKEGLKWKKRA